MKIDVFAHILPKKYLETLKNESPPSKLGGICSVNSRYFVTRIRFSAPNICYSAPMRP